MTLVGKGLLKIPCNDEMIVFLLAVRLKTPHHHTKIRPEKTKTNPKQHPKLERPTSRNDRPIERWQRTRPNFNVILIWFPCHFFSLFVFSSHSRQCHGLFYSIYYEWWHLFCSFFSRSELLRLIGFFFLCCQGGGGSCICIIYPFPSPGSHAFHKTHPQCRGGDPRHNCSTQVSRATNESLGISKL